MTAIATIPATTVSPAKGAPIAYHLALALKGEIERVSGGQRVARVNLSAQHRIKRLPNYVNRLTSVRPSVGGQAIQVCLDVNLLDCREKSELE